MRTGILTGPEQVANRLRDELRHGRWSGTLPGIYRLSAELGFSRKPVEQALLMLEDEGLLVPQGVGRRRKIVRPTKIAIRPLRVAILDHDPSGIKECMADLPNRLSDEGHTAFFTDKSLVELDMNVRRIAHLVRKTEADIWVVVSAPAQVLGWFVNQGIPVFSIFGNFVDLQIPGMGISYASTLMEVTRKLLTLGHRRIVFLASRGRMENPPNRLWQSLLDEMENRGIATGPHNLPNWQDSPDGFHSLLKSLFDHAPPTALLIEEIPHLFAALQFCAQHGIKVPQDVSLISMFHGSEFDYCQPTMARIRSDLRPIAKRVAQWANHMSMKQEDLRKTYIKSDFIDGGTIGPAPL